MTPEPRGPGRRLGRAVAEHLPPLVVAVLLAPWVISQGSAWPWRPNLIDLDVYRLTAQAVLSGQDVYAVRTPQWNLPFIYPPIAALLLAPVAVLPRTVLQMVWIVANVGALCLVLRRAGVRPGWTLGGVASLLIAAVEPVRTTIGYGQVNLLLMALVVADVLPGRNQGRRGLEGIGLGLAAAIKLTPLLFVVYAVATRRWRLAGVAVTSFLVLTGIGLAAMPGQSATFARKLLADDLYGDADYIGNQSLVGAIARVGGGARAVELGALAAGAVIALLATWCAARLHERRADVWAVGVVGVATCLASPIAWTHHYVWVVLALVGTVAPAGVRMPLWLRLPYAGWAAWVALCPVLVLGRWARPGVSLRTPGQLALGLIGPAWAAALVVATLAWFWVPARDGPSRMLARGTAAADAE